MSFRKFYPKGYNPIHEVNDWCYVRQIIRAARRGDSIPAFVVDSENLLTGTHRCAANNIMEMLYEARSMSPKPSLIDAVQFDDLDMDDDTRDAIIEAMEYRNYDIVDELLGDRA